MSIPLPSPPRGSEWRLRQILSREVVLLSVFGTYLIIVLSALQVLRDRSHDMMLAELVPQADRIAMPLIEGQVTTKARTDGTYARWAGPDENLAAYGQDVRDLRHAAKGTVIRRLTTFDGQFWLRSAYSDGTGRLLVTGTASTPALETLRQGYEREYVAVALAGLAILCVVLIYLGRAQRYRDGAGTPRPWTRRERLIFSGSTLLCLLIFLVTFRLSHSQVNGTVYLIAVLASLWANRGAATQAIALLSTLAIVTKALFGPEEPDAWSMLSDATLAIFAVWTVSVMGLWRHRAARNEIRATAQVVEEQSTRAELESMLSRITVAETELRRDKALLDTVAEIAHIGGWYVDAATMTPRWSPEVFRIHGVEPGDPADIERAFSFYPPEARSTVQGALGEAMKLGTRFDLTLPFIAADGKQRWVRAIGHPEYLAGRIVGVSGAFQDVTEQHLARLRLETAARLSLEGHWEFDYRSKRLWLSATLGQLLGMSAEESYVSLADAAPRLHPEDADSQISRVLMHSDGEAPFDLQLRVRRADGQYRWFRVRGAVERDHVGRALRCGGTASDAHDQVLSRNLLADVQARFDRAIRGSNDGLYEWSAHDTAGVWYSPRSKEMLGYAPDERVPVDLLDLLPSAARDALREVIRSKPDDRDPFVFDCEIMHRDGSSRWIRLRGRRECDFAGNTVRIAGSMQDISTEKQAEAALRAATESADAASRAKSDFLANMSHEIRTPMNGVIGMTELLFLTSLDERQIEYARTIKSSAGTLLAIINDVLDFSKIESGKLEIERVEMSLRERLEDVARILAPQAAERGLELVLNVDGSVPERNLGDPVRFSQVVLNLVSNALKFTRQGQVVIDAALVANSVDIPRVRVSVADTGVGMDHETMARLFEPFAQADASTTRRFGGTGLGLSIARRLAGMMNGAITVSSEPGIGSEFSFTLECTPANTERPREAALALVRDSRVLVLEPNPAARVALSGLLSQFGCTTIAVADSAEARSLLTSPAPAPFDVMFVNSALGQSDGLTFGRQLLALQLPSVPALILSCDIDSPPAPETLAAAGFAAALTKPLRRIELLQSLLKALQAEHHLEAEHSAARDRAGFENAALGRAVLIAEDNPVNQQVAKRMLEHLGCVVSVVGNGRDAVEACDQRRFALVLMDIQMPLMDGLEATREIRRREPSGQRMPIVALTASAITGELERCIAAGMDQLLTKPIDIARLRDTLAAYDDAGQRRHEYPASAQTVTPAIVGADAAATGTAATPAGTDVIDVGRLRDAIGDDPEFISVLLQTFRATCLESLVDLRAALRETDRPAIQRFAHKIKGGARSSCADLLGDLAADLEDQAMELPVAALHDHVARLAREIDCIPADIDALVRSRVA